ncbi:MAG: TIM barrel protein [Planctomycetota bacterium]
MATLRPGLVSVTFRRLEPHPVIELAAEAELEAIEWGGDVHVPHGDVAVAREVGQLTREAGLRISAYGSYYRLGHEADDDVPDLSAVLDSAEALETSVVRVWAGRQDGRDADDAYFDRVAEDGRRACDAASERGIAVHAEWHGGTVTDCAASASRLAEAVPDLVFDWQPSRNVDVETRLAELRSIERLGRVHVFHWLDTPDGADRRPLEEGSSDWRRYLDELSNHDDDRDLLLEFVRGDDVEAFRNDARTLRHWLAEA